MTVKGSWRLLPATTAAVVATAAFTKSFVPFFLIGSTPIFAATCVFGILLVMLAGRNLAGQATHATDILLVMALFYFAIIASFLVNSLHRVPVTHLCGILIFHGLFLVFGFAAARALKAVFVVLLVQAAVYTLVIAQYAVRVGDPMRHGYLDDIFGVGIPIISITFHQTIGTAVGLATIAFIALTAGRMRLLAFAVLPLVFLFLFHIAARTAMVALSCSLLFWGGAALWARSKKLAIAGVTLVILAAMAASLLFYQRALHDKTVDAVAPDAISRTIREIQDPRPLFRMQIWKRTIDHIASEPDRLLFGRGIGVYSIDEGFGPPNWLLKPAEGNKYYPHNIYLDVLYEAGLAGLLPVIALTLLPLCISLGRWNKYGTAEQAAILLYVFYFVAMLISGSFAFSYDFQFFLGLSIGVVALGRKQDRSVPGIPAELRSSGAPRPA